LYWTTIALGTRSLTVDLTDPAGRQVAREQIRDADVFIESWTPGVASSLGLGYADLAAENPALIYASVSSHGAASPLSRQPSTELPLLAASGLLGIPGDGDRPPIPVGYPQTIFHAGAQAVADIAMALFETGTSGLGQHLDVSVQACMVSTVL